MKYFVVLMPTVISLFLLVGCQLFFFPGEYEDLLSGARNSNKNTGSSLNTTSAVYVSPSGSDANSGFSKNTPVRSIQKAIQIAVQNNISHIYLSVGTYTPGNGLNATSEYSGVVLTNNNISIIGGWDSNFSSIVGYSDLNGNNILRHVMYVENVSGIVLRNLMLRGGNANDSMQTNHMIGGGIYLSNVSYSSLSNLLILSNNSLLGGGFYMLDSDYNSIIDIEVFQN
ncbi:MAG: hypothetical protein N3D81_02715, partial [Spirochaetes bacterium]|nr:hypothetical protein [Spirochaetota bacterium]